MAEPNPTQCRRKSTGFCWAFFVILLIPVVASVILYRLETFDAAPLPEDYSRGTISVPAINDRVLDVSVRIGDGLLPGPEDFAYDAGERAIYTGCDDGWIRRIPVAEAEEAAAVEDWVFVGGRPLGLAFAPDGTLIVAESRKGLLAVKKDRTVQLLTDSAEGLAFALTDGVDVTSDGTIYYFTDASYKYSLDAFMLDVFEARPHGRLLSYHPETNRTFVLARDLYFANGVALSPQQDSLVFCETLLRRCKKYYIDGEKKGTVDRFIDELPGFPDNIRYDGEGHYWIGLSSGRNLAWDATLEYPFLRKLMVALDKYVKMPNLLKNGGVMSVSLDGEPFALYSDPALYQVTGAVKIGNYLYQGSFAMPHINRLDLAQHAARVKSA